MNISWASLKPIGGAAITQYTAIMPFIGYAILFNKYSVHIFADSMEYISPESNLKLPIFENLYFLYFGLVSLGLGALIFRVSCPNEIIEYGTAEIFVERTAQTTTRRELIKMAVFLENFNNIEDDLRRQVSLLLNVLRNSDSSNLAIEQMAFLKGEYYNSKNFSGTFARIVCAIVMIFGLLLLAIPTLKLTKSILFSLFM